MLFVTCQKDDPCSNIICLNDGFCANGICNCKEGYTGSDCSQEKTPSSITITAVTVTKWPATASGGGGWDLFDGPDLTFTIGKGGSEIYRSNIFYEDAVQGQQYTFDVNIKLDSPNSEHSILLYDYDDNITANDFMGGIGFIPYTSGGKFPEVRILDVNASGVAFELDFSYQFN